jgi:two-component system, OmpR family, alkaline phosphatase synthesis response regulator PhoP
LKYASGFKKETLMVERNQSRILLVEDEKNVGSTLVERLEREGFEVIWVKTVETAQFEISSRSFDLVILDVSLPDGSGFDVAANIRKKQPGAAVMFLTAFGNPEDRIRGLELGAEDYVVKPFHLQEFILRVRNGLKRAKYLAWSLKGSESEVQVGRATIHFLKFEAVVDGKVEALTHKETALLKLLVERRGCVVSRDEILNHVWSEDEFPTPRTVDNFIMRLRKLVEWNPEQPTIIKSVRGVGYQLP